MQSTNLIRDYFRSPHTNKELHEMLTNCAILSHIPKSKSNSEYAGVFVQFPADIAVKNIIFAKKNFETTHSMEISF